MDGKWLQKVELVQVYFFGIGIQCLHFLEEYLTGFQTEYPKVLGLQPWSDRFFVSLNLILLAIFVLAGLGLLLRLHLARVIVWVFALAMFANGIVHPALTLWRGRYFPGTITAPIHLLIGIVLIVILLGPEQKEKVY